MRADRQPSQTNGVRTGILLEASRKSCCLSATLSKPTTAGGHLCHHLEESVSELSQKADSRDGALSNSDDMRTP